VIIKSQKTFTPTSPEYAADWSSEIASTLIPTATKPGWKITGDSLGHNISGAPYQFQFSIESATGTTSAPTMYLKFVGADNGARVHGARDLNGMKQQAWSLTYRSKQDSFLRHGPVTVSMFVGIEAIYMVAVRSGGGVFDADTTFTVSSILY
tara:strand:- start:1588 stop:2043 length:456 start_codon:yes stop_codon:yes gene_type:complete